MSREWPLLSLGFKPTFLRRSCSSSFHRSSTLSFPARNYLESCPAQDTGCPGNWCRSDPPYPRLTFSLLPLSFLRFFRIGSFSFDGQTNLLHPSNMTFEDKPPSKLGSLALHLLSSVGLTKLTLRPQDGSIAAASNLTILNVFLVRFGPMPEKRLVQTLVMVQVST